MNRRTLASIALLVTFFFLTGCSDDAAPNSVAKKEGKTFSFEGVQLKLAVADDPAMLRAVQRLQGEWQAQTGGTFEAIAVKTKDFENVKELPADAMICPQGLFGALADGGLLAPVPAEVKRGDEWGDVFDLPKLRENLWGEDILAIPFGSPVFTLYSRTDVLEKMGRKPPRTWREFADLAQAFAALKKSGDKAVSGLPQYAVLEPLQSPWAGWTLLAHAASYLKHRDNYSALFDIETMKPMIDSPGMVRALKELRESCDGLPQETLKLDPAGVREAFAQGKCLLAITWPSGSEKAGKSEIASSNAVENFQVSFSELPGAFEMYNASARTWNKRDEEDSPFVPLLSVSGRMGVVSTTAAKKEAAFQLLTWLSGKKFGQDVCPVSPDTTLFRVSQISRPLVWTESSVPAPAAVRYGELTQATLQNSQWIALKLPGREEYIKALDEAVQSVLGGKAAPEEALGEAAKKWEEITARLGVEKQRKAYRLGLGLE